MVRDLIFIPVALLAVIGGGVALCAAAGWTVHAREMMIAAASSAAACLFGLAPLFVVRRGDQTAVSQAGLVGTLLHLMGHVIVAAYVILAKPPLHPSFIWWLMPFYWVTLAALAGVFVRRVRQAPVTGAAGN